MRNNYLCCSWQAFIQQIVHNAAHGYYYYNYYVLAENRRKNLPNIDQTIISRFDTGKSKDRRYHHKKAGIANYKFLRYELMLIILKTDGREMCAERLQTRFKDIRLEPLEIPVGDSLILKLHKKADKGMTVHLTKACYRELKYNMLSLLEHRHVDSVKYHFNALNDIPAYAGIIEHKKKLLTEILKAAKVHKIPLRREDFRLATKLTRVKVF